jgi:hypothetical protein
VFVKDARTGCQSFVNHQHDRQTSPVDDGPPTELFLLISDHSEAGQRTIHSLITLDVASLATSMVVSGLVTYPSTVLHADRLRHTLLQSATGGLYAMKLYSLIRAGLSTIAEEAEVKVSKSVR